MIATAAKHTAAIGATISAIVANIVTDSLPHIATAAAAFSAAAAGVFYVRQIYLSFRNRK